MTTGSFGFTLRHVCCYDEDDDEYCYYCCSQAAEVRSLSNVDKTLLGTRGWMSDRLLILILIKIRKATTSKTSKEVMNNNEEDDQQQQQEQQRFNPLVIVQRDNEKDYQDLKRFKKSSRMRFNLPGNAGRWPRNLEDAEYGLQPLRIFNRENFKSLT